MHDIKSGRFTNNIHNVGKDTFAFLCHLSQSFFLYFLKYICNFIDWQSGNHPSHCLIEMTPAHKMVFTPKTVRPVINSGAVLKLLRSVLLSISQLQCQHILFGIIIANIKLTLCHYGTGRCVDYVYMF